MTTKPKARKFRIRRSTPTSAQTAATAESETDTAPTPEVERLRPRVVASDGETRAEAATPEAAPDAGPETGAEIASSATAPEPAAAPARSGQVASPREATLDAEIDAIRREGLTGRQLRMARRVAQKHNLPATSDFDAVRLLRQHGIDPFQRSNMLELVVPRAAEPEAGAGGEPPKDRVQLPQTVPSGKSSLPSTELSPAEQRDREITEIQRDIGRRRRRKMALLLTRLFFFVAIPTAVVGYYYYAMATPMYATKSEFLILKADNAGGGTGLGSLLSGTQFATSQDSIAVQSYLQSKDAMLRLDEDEGFKAHFSQPWIDPIQRLAPDPTNEQAYKLYSKDVKIGYDPTEGVVKMEVVAADPQISANFARSLLSYAEERVNHLSEQKRSDQMRDALKGFEDAQVQRRKAQEALVSLQQKGAILDPEGVITTLRGQINNIEMQLQEKQLELAALMDNTRPNQAKVDGARGDVRRLQALLDQLNERMVDASKGENSLAQLSVSIQMAQADLATRDMMLQSALQQVEQTRMEANRQVRYLTTSVEPVASQDPAYPRKFENTILAFLVFSGIYLMISLTASILREQITS
ncbi:capsule biosynthesis protein [Pseudodonghicola flavimaris]|uniref:Capsule biosynthesis protein n=1 Tax=Pseudodonghicola flavimaris TaxID=3050036 RepID=A0ABT7EZ26_9RHOB|nr:capsule biosynthesis protein [Pseudodonghicola flavimaris]MDK3017510.1 capsule biosynthesis protein [Pseudodonghicola flavimaris]